VNFRIKLRGPVLQDVIVGSFTPNPEDNILSSSEYHDHMLIEVLGNHNELGIVQKITLYTDEGEELVVYDLQSGIIINVPLFDYSYDEEDPDYGVGLNQLEKFGQNYQTVNKFSGISSGVKQDAYLHAFSHQENEYEIDKSISLSTLVWLRSDQILGKDYPSKVSLLNYLMVGHLYESFKVHEGMEFRPRFTGLGRIISPDTNTVNIDVFHSSCLGPDLTRDTHSADMLQFMSGKFPEWFSHFKDNIVRTAEYNVENSEKEFRRVKNKTDEEIKIIIWAKEILSSAPSENLTVSVAKIDEIFNQLTSFLNEIQHKLDMFGGLFQNPLEVLTFEDVTAMLDPIQFGLTSKDKEEIKNLLLQLVPQSEELPKPDSFINPDIRFRKMITKPIQSEELEVLEELYGAMDDFDKSIGKLFKEKLVRRNQSLRTYKAFKQYKGLDSPSILPSITDLPEPVRIFLQGLEPETAKSIYPAWMTRKRRRAGSKAKKKKKKKQTKKKPKKKPKKEKKKKPTKKKQTKKKPKKQKGGKKRTFKNLTPEELEYFNEFPNLTTAGKRKLLKDPCWPSIERPECVKLMVKDNPWMLEEGGDKYVQGVVGKKNLLNKEIEKKKKKQSKKKKKKK